MYFLKQYKHSFLSEVNMPVIIGHHGGIHFPHLYQCTRGAGKTGQLGSRTVTRVPDRIHHAIRRSDFAHSGEQNLSPEIQERSAEQRAHERQKNSGPAPEFNQGRNPRPLPELEQNNNQRTVGEQKKNVPPPLPPKPRMGPFGWGKLSTGSGITVSAPWLTEKKRRDLEKKYDISVTPVRTGCKEIGYVFGQTPGNIGQIYLDCHGSAKDELDFEKPVGVALKFVATKNHILVNRPVQLASNIAKGRVLYKKADEQIFDYDSKKMLKNYKLSGFQDNEGRYFGNAENCAKHVHELKAKGTPINYMVLNPGADGVHLKDVIQGVNDTFHRMPELILSNCRAESEDAETVSPSYRHTGKKRDPKFTPNSEKRMAGNWTHKIHKLNNPFWRANHRKDFKQ
ncbi:hypothetical protein F0858_20215 [Salmonella enterica]|nr:hypothetical protein [Salmonella enterica subsp. enterica]ECR0567612.1 hypothetical protein [Salmonella enterica]